MSLKRVVVTGLGALTPLGKTAEELENLLAGKLQDLLLGLTLPCLKQSLRARLKTLNPTVFSTVRKLVEWIDSHIRKWWQMKPLPIPGWICKETLIESGLFGIRNRRYRHLL